MTPRARTPAPAPVPAPAPDPAPRPHVLQLITTLDPGGAEHQLLTLVTRLGDRFRFTVAFFKGGGELVPRFEARGVPAVGLGIRGWIDPACYVRLARLIRRLAPDLVATHLFKADVYGAAAAAGTGIPLVSHKHNEDRYLLNPLFGALGRATAARCHRAIAISEAVTRFYVRRAAFPAAPFTRVLHGIEAAPPRTPPAAMRRRFAPDDDRVLLIGTAARLTAQKGLDTLLRATRRLCDREPRLRCVVAGRGEDEPRLRALCRSLGIEAAVRFAGQLADIPAFLRALDLFVLPSRWEGFGIVLLEAMAAGCPIVASRVGGIPEAITDGVNGRLVPPDDEVALAEAVSELLRDPPRRRALARAGYETFRRRFTAARMAEETAAVYEEAIHSRPVEPPGRPAAARQARVCKTV